MIPEHTKYAIDEWVDYGHQPGSFLKAVFENNLFDAIAYADEEHQAALSEIVRYVYNSTPSGCWGSKATFEAWQKHKGMSGHPNPGLRGLKGPF